MQAFRSESVYPSYVADGAVLCEVPADSMVLCAVCRVDHIHIIKITSLTAGSVQAVVCQLAYSAL